MNKVYMTISFEYAHEFDEKEAQKAIDLIVNFKDMDKLQPKQKAYTGIIKEAFDNGGYEKAIRELVRYNTRMQFAHLIGAISETPIRVKLND